MSDRYGELVQSSFGKKIAKNLGLPTPVALERYESGQPVLTGEVLLGFGNDEQTALKNAILANLSRHNAHVATTPAIISYAQDFNGILMDSDQKIKAESVFKVVVFDASELHSIKELDKLYDFFHPIARKIKASGRVIIFGRPECCTDSAGHAIAQRALEGFVKSIAKEFKNGIACNLVYVKKGLENHIDSTLDFLMSSKSAYVSGQVVSLLNNTKESVAVDTAKPLLGKKIAVTGASRGIGASISTVLAEQGAEVICLDLPSSLAELQKHAGSIGSKALPLDITDSKAGEKLLEAVGTLDGIVHNAGITLDKTLAKMDESKWQKVLMVNLQAVFNINDYLFTNNGLAENGRIVCVSSISGIAGNLGQTNYATSKAGVIGLVKATAKNLTNGQTINAVAPGFIETKMTAQMPFAIREAGRRMNSMSQGGEPVDVAQTIAWLLAPNSGAINGQVIRVCGQSVLGA